MVSLVVGEDGADSESTELDVADNDDDEDDDDDDDDEEGAEEDDGALGAEAMTFN